MLRVLLSPRFEMVSNMYPIFGALIFAGKKIPFIPRPWDRVHVLVVKEGYLRVLEGSQLLALFLSAHPARVFRAGWGTSEAAQKVALEIEGVPCGRGCFFIWILYP